LNSSTDGQFEVYKGRIKAVEGPPDPFIAFVANLDILGFSSALSTLGITKLAKMYAEALTLAHYTKQAEIESVIEITSVEFDNDSDMWWDHQPIGSPRPAFQKIRKMAVFSDCIFLVTADQSNDSLSEIVDLSNCIFQFFLQQKLAMRGAICKNEVLVWDEQQILLGQGIVDSFLFQESLEVIGIVAHDSVGPNPRLSDLQSVRIKNNSSVSVRVPKPVQSPRPPLLQHPEALNKIFDELTNLANSSGDQKVIDKYQNGKNIVQYMLK
jgi:hypothetical protein